MQRGQFTLSSFVFKYLRTLQNLLPKMLPSIDLPRALLRGRFMQAAARIEIEGIPVDAETLREVESRWPDIQRRLIGVQRPSR